jgi:hypothetical protein
VSESNGLPKSARALIIGAGIGGNCLVYHLAKLGWKEVVLVEQYGLTHGSTWHSAGLVGQLRSTVSLTKMMQYSVGLYADLARETGKDPGWHELGGLRLASSQERYEEIQRQAGWAKSFGLPIEIVSPAEAKELFPPMSTDGVVAAAFLPQDGYLDPSQLTFALADGARLLGAALRRVCDQRSGHLLEQDEAVVQPAHERRDAALAAPLLEPPGLAAAVAAAAVLEHEPAAVTVDDAVDAQRAALGQVGAHQREAVAAGDGGGVRLAGGCGAHGCDARRRTAPFASRSSRIGARNVAARGEAGLGGALGGGGSIGGRAEFHLAWRVHLDDVLGSIWSP